MIRRRPKYLWRNRDAHMIELETTRIVRKAFIDRLRQEALSPSCFATGYMAQLLVGQYDMNVAMSKMVAQGLTIGPSTIQPQLKSFNEMASGEAERALSGKRPYDQPGQNLKGGF